MRKIFSVLGMAIGAVACGEPVAAPDCTTDCGTEVRLVSVLVTSGTADIRSGDTLRVTVVIENQSSRPTANSTQLQVFTTQFDAQQLEIPLGSIAAGTRVTRDVNIGLAVFGRTAQLRDSIIAQVYMTDPQGDSRELAAAHSAGFAVTASTFELLGVPAVLRYPSLQTAQLRIANRSRHAIPADTVHFCLWDVDYCAFAGVRPVVIAAVAASQTTTRDVPVDVIRDPAFGAEVWSTDDIALRACYAHSYACSHPVIDLKPDYEAFCQVRRLTLGQAAAATTVGRCGLGLHTDRLDILSFDAPSAGTYDVTVSGPGTSVGSQIYVLSAEGEQLNSYTTVSHALAVLPEAGRYYVTVGAFGIYSILVQRQ